MPYTTQSILSALKETGMMPLFSHHDAEVSKEVVDAAYRGGVRVFELTNRSANAFDIFTQLIYHTSKYPDLILGIGTIMDGATTEKFINAGAHFIISPIMKPEMAEVCRKHDRPWIPGCATLTEMVTAQELGAPLIKIFPGNVLGPQFVSAVLPVVPSLRLMPTGGVEPTEESLSAWFKSGVVCVGMGSKLFTKEILEKQDWKVLENKVRDILAIIKRVR